MRAARGRLVGLVVPAMNFLLLMAVGLDLTPDDFARVRRQGALSIPYVRCLKAAQL